MQTQVQRDVRDLSRIRSLDTLPRLLAAAASHSARLLNLTELAAPFQLSHQTIHDHLALLEGVFLIQRNRAVHRMLVDGVTVGYRTSEGGIRWAQARVMDFEEPDNNDWLAVNQFTVTENKRTRRPDVVLFVNGLPLAVIELKNAADEDATIWTAFQQLQTYKAEVPSLFAFIQRAVEDGATVPIYYESRLAKLALDDAERPSIDPEGEEITEGEEIERKEKLKTKWAQLEAIVGAEKRLRVVARDMVEHFEKRLEAMDGKAMVVCMSRRICVELYHHIVRLRPQWHHDADEKGMIKVIAVQAALAKRAPAEARPEEELDHAVRQLISRAVAPEGVVDIFAAAGLEKPDISILSEEFLAEVRGMPQKNLAVELLHKLLKSEPKTRRRKNVVQARSFAEMLEKTIRRYQNRAIEAAQVIEELLALAREIREADARGEELGLSEAELAFYDALETNDSAVKVLGDEALRTIACELVQTVRSNVTIDWTMRENVRANLRRLVKRVLRKHGYPPDKQEKATQTVLEQAEVLSSEWVAR